MKTRLVVEVSEKSIVLNAFEVQKKELIWIASKSFDNVIEIDSSNQINLFNLHQIIEDFIEEEDLSKGEVHFLLGNLTGISMGDIVPLTYKSEVEFKKALPNKVESVFSVSLDDYYYRYSKGKKEQETHVHVVSKRLVEGLLFDGKSSFLKLKKGWVVKSVIPYDCIYSEALPKDQGDYAILNLYSNEYQLRFYKEGKIRSTAIRWFYSSSDFQRIVEEVGEEINQTITEQSIANELSIREMVIGRTAYPVDEIGDHLAQRFNMPVSLIDPGDVTLDVELKNNLEQEHSDHVLFINNLGKYQKMNFAPERVGDGEKGLLTTVSVFACFFFLGTFMFNSNIDSVIEQKQELIQEKSAKTFEIDNKMQSLNLEISESEQVIEHYNQYVRAIEKLGVIEDRHFISDILRLIPNNTPSNVKIDSVNLAKQNKVLKINGRSDNYSGIGFLAIALEEYGEVTIEKIDNNELNNQDGYPFEVILNRD